MKLETLSYVLFAGLLGLLFSWKEPLPRIFLIGDSISMQYEPFLKEYLKGAAILESRRDIADAKFDLDVPRGRNGGDSKKVLSFIKTALATPTFDKPNYMLLNCGLHDIKRSPNDDKYQVDSMSYRRNLKDICRLLDDHGIQLIWIRSTPVIDSVHNPRSKDFKRFSSDLNKYNSIADEVFLQNNVPAIDLFSFSKSLGRDAIIDHVHYSVPASRKQAAFIGGRINELFNQLGYYN